MAKTALNIIKGWFGTGKFPTGAQFNDALDSFRHKDDVIEITSSLQNELDKKASYEMFLGHIQDTDNPHNFTLEQLGIFKEIISFENTSTPTILNYQDSYSLYGNYPTVELYISTGSGEMIKSNDQPKYFFVNDLLDYIAFDLGAEQTGLLILKR